MRAGNADPRRGSPGGLSSQRRESLRRLASRQHGRVSRAQLLDAGFTARMIDGEIRRGGLIAEHRGVYAAGYVGDALRGRAMSAALACGASATVSHRTAAQLHKLLPLDDTATEIEVTLGSRGRRSRPGIRVHHADLDRRDRRLQGAIPLTSPARTLLDLAAAAPAEELERAFDEAVFRPVVRAPQLADVLARNTGRPGAARLRSLADAEAKGERNRLEGERRLGQLIRAAKLPEPVPNVRIGRFVVDFLWPQHRVAVAMDGFASHGDRQAFEGDRARDAELQALDYAVIRITWRQLTREPFTVVARLAARLALSGRELALS